MERKFRGQANHVFSEDEITTLTIHSLVPEDDRTPPCISIADDNSSLIIHSIEQWEQLNAIVRTSFDLISD